MLASDLILILLARPFDPDPPSYDKARILVSAGSRVTILAWDKGCTREQVEVMDGIRVKHLRLLRSEYFSRTKFLLCFFLYNFLAWLFAARLVWKEHHICLSASDVETLPCAFLLKLLAPTRVRLVYEAREFSLGLFAVRYNLAIAKLASAAEALMASRADAIITAFDGLTDYFKARLRRNQQVLTIYEFKDPTILKRIDKSVAKSTLGWSGFLVVYIGTLRPPAAMSLFLETAELLMQKGPHDIKMAIVGEGPLMPAIKKEVRMRNLTNTIIVGGRLGRIIDFREIATYYSASDLIYSVYDAKDENPHIMMTLPGKMFEAIQMGVPIIVGKGLAMSRFVEKWQVGLTTEESPTGVRNAILTLRGSPNLRATMARNAEVASRAIGWDIVRQKTLSVYGSSGLSV